MTGLFTPRSVAVLGASEDPSRIGSRTFAMAGIAGFKGPVYPVNPRGGVIQGVRAYRSLAEIEGPVDCAIMAIPAARVLDAIRDCVAKGVGTAIVFTAGFAEIGEAGRAMQAEMRRIARAGGLRVLGPNCTGAFNLRTGAYLSFYDAGVRGFTPGRNVGVVSQSGGYGAHIINLAQLRGLSVSHWVTTGNECDIEIGEVLEAFAADPDVDVLVGYAEGIRDAATFIRALRLARENRKPVILMKAGRTKEGASAAASHTASLAGDDAAYDAVFREFGVHRARTTEEVLDVAYAALGGIFPPDRRIGVMTNSGGMGVQIADFAEDAGLELPGLPPAAQAKVMALNPNASAQNPVDFTAQWLSEPGLIPGCMEVLLGDCAMPAVICFMGSSGSNPGVIEGVRSVVGRYPGRLVIMGISVGLEVARVYEAMGCLVFQEPARAMVAVAALAGFARIFGAAMDVGEAPGGVRIAAGLRLNEHEAKRLLGEWGVTVPGDAAAATPDAAAEAARRIGFPVGVKILSADIPHKTELGGVVLGVLDAEAVRGVAAAMLGRVGELCPEAKVDGVLVTPMVRGGVECIVGAHLDPVFGPMVMVGMGGTGVELRPDVAWRRAPVTPEQALEMVRSLALYPLLTGYRGRAVLDSGALAMAVAAISRLAVACGEDLRTIEVNPLLVLPLGVVALDAVVETDAGARN